MGDEFVDWEDALRDIELNIAEIKDSIWRLEQYMQANETELAATREDLRLIRQDMKVIGLFLTVGIVIVLVKVLTAL